MEIKCTPVFFQNLRKIERKPSHKKIESLISDHFFNKEFSDLLSGMRIHDIPRKPFIKKRLGGKGGYRIYYVADENEEIIYLLYLHPKTGAFSQSNITAEQKVNCLKELVYSKKKKELLSLSLNKETSKIESNRN